MNVGAAVKEKLAAGQSCTVACLTTLQTLPSDVVCVAVKVNVVFDE